MLDRSKVSQTGLKWSISLILRTNRGKEWAYRTKIFQNWQKLVYSQYKVLIFAPKSHYSRKWSSFCKAKGTASLPVCIIVSFCHSAKCAIKGQNISKLVNAFHSYTSNHSLKIGQKLDSFHDNNIQNFHKHAKWVSGPKNIKTDPNKKIIMNWIVIN